ncbi:hypothetical protein [Pseudoclavibacter sp. VKM Ac-2888]|uniref:hypothetical protein n=1 Tax=Pseudoclavibacter sp. VKM Ac-2888 TaxID=2783830 RepID=UPI00188B3C41|nr:hypothetical protein [Pseudoclavibacter sp. VKM Ac-2888]MBF4549222.1 hypothetical protein [Pseudoclavibacter sp. VKM Ac-2888]
MARAVVSETVTLLAGDRVDPISIPVTTSEGTAVDLSEWTDWRCWWKAGTKVVAAQVGTERLAEGVLEITLTGAQTRELLGAAESVTGSYDAEATRTDDTEPTTWIEGKFRIRDDVTKEGTP